MQPRIVLVTGASSGIGEKIARLLVRRGDFPILVARRSEALQRLIRELGTGAAYPCDVTDGDSVRELVEQVKQTWERIDVLINNAGYGLFGGALEIPMSDYEGMIQTNYLGTVRLTRAVIPLMLEAGGGRIVNIASVAGLTGSPNLAAYCASKYALLGFSESLDLEFAPTIRVGVLCPGPVQTPFFRGKILPGSFPHRSPGGSSIRYRSPPRHRSHRSTAGSRRAAHLRTRPRFPGPLSPDLPENRQKAVRSPFSTSKNGRRKPRRRFFFLDIDREMNGPFSLFGRRRCRSVSCDSQGTCAAPLLLIKFSPGCQQKVWVCSLRKRSKEWTSFGKKAICGSDGGRDRRRAGYRPRGGGDAGPGRGPRLHRGAG